MRNALLCLVSVGFTACGQSLPKATPYVVIPSPTTAPPTQTARAIATPVDTRVPTIAPTVTSAPTAMPTNTPSAPASATPSPAQIEQLTRAAENGDTTAALKLIHDGVGINARDSRGRTAVMAATHGNRPDTVRALIGAGADVNIQDERLDNPFLYAGAEGLLDVLRAVIEAKPNTRLTNRFGGTALIPAAERGHVEVARELLTRTDVNVNHINNLGWTALLEAIVLSNGGTRHQQMVQLLVDHGADITIADKAGVSPLQHARSRGFKEIERILLAVSR